MDAVLPDLCRAALPVLPVDRRQAVERIDQLGLRPGDDDMASQRNADTAFVLTQPILDARFGEAPHCNVKKLSDAIELRHAQIAKVVFTHTSQQSLRLLNFFVGGFRSFSRPIVS